MLPAVSIQVKQLSEAAGLPLVERVGKQIYLTPAGETVAEACHDFSNAWSGWLRTWRHCRGWRRAA